MTADQITVPTSELLALIRDVKQAASVDPTLPMLDGVMLNTSHDEKRGHRLVATATDRYCILQGTAGASGSLAQRLFLTNQQLAQVSASLRPYGSAKRVGVAQTSITIADGKVTIEQLSLDQLGAVSVSFKHNAMENFPDLGKILRDNIEREPSTDMYHVDGARMATFARIAASLRAPMSVRSTGAAHPVIIQIGRDLLGMLMPMRTGAEATAPIDIPEYVAPVMDESAAA